MPKILYIESATEVCSICIADNDKILAHRENLHGNSHSEFLTEYILEVFNEAVIKPEEIDAVTVSMGPGSYTGLRIGASAAKGICYSTNKPLIAVSTLLSLANGARKKCPDNLCLCPMIDARRMEVFTALFEHNLEEITPIEAKIIDETSFKSLLDERKILFFGNGAAKSQEVIKNENAFFDTEILPDASFLIEPALKKYEKGLFEDTAYFEPFYLKEFIAGKPTVKALRN